MTRALPLAEVAEALGVTVRTVADWIARGELRAVNLSRCRGSQKPRLRVLETDLQTFLAARATDAARPATRRRALARPENWIDFV